MRRCGYKGSDLRNRILEENKVAFIHDDFGKEDYSKLELASAMLSYIAANSSGINDGIHYVDDCIDTAVQRYFPNDFPSHGAGSAL